MKKLLFILLCLSTTQIYSFKSLKNIFTSYESMNQNDEIKEAIANSDVNKVLSLVRSDVNFISLQDYIELANENFGRTPNPTFQGRFMGTIKIALGMALLYKTGDYFKTEYTKAKSDFISRYKSVHNILMDIACLSGFISSSNFLTAGIESINPRSNYKKQLLINLYLKSLLKN